MINNSKNEVPTGWKWTSLDTVADILDSQRVPVNAKEREARQGNVPYYGATGQVGFIDDYLFDEELVLLGEDGAPFFDPSKQKAYIIRGKSWVNNHAHVLRTKAGIPSSYLKYYLDIVDYHGFVTGTTRAKLNQKAMRQIPIPLAPPEQQKRIVAEIEKQFSRLDEAVANLKRVKANLKRYKAAVLKAAVEGKLTEEWRKQHPDVEPADKLLERILAERREKWQGRGKYKDPAAPDTTDLPELPEGWVWASIEGVALNVVDCPHSTPKWTDKGRLCVRTTEFEPGRLNLTSVRYVSPETFEIRNARLVPKSGDILYSREGAILGIACEIPPGVDLCLGQRMLLIRPSEVVRSTWIMNWLNSQFILQRVRTFTGGSASPHLNLRDIRSFPIPLPPSEEQNQIVAEVEGYLSIVNGVEAQVDASLRRAERMRQSILKSAFSCAYNA